MKFSHSWIKKEIVAEHSQTQVCGEACILIPDKTGLGELSYWTAPAMQRQGIATRLIAALIYRVFHRRMAGRIVAFIAPDNPCSEASKKILLRAGFVLDPAQTEWAVRVREEGFEGYTLTRAAWLARHSPPAPETLKNFALSGGAEEAPLHIAMADATPQRESAS